MPAGNLQGSLSHIFWMGGAPCSGKSSIAGMLAERYGLQTYHVDAAFDEHKVRFVPSKHPTMHKWTTTPWPELWMQPPDVLLAEAISAYREHFQFILEDLLSLPRGAPVLAEGTALLPDCVADLLEHPRQALWVVPAEDFQRTVYPNRGEWVQWILGQCDDPEQALQNWMDRDVAFARWVTARTRKLGLKLMRVDGSRSIVENAKAVAEHFRLL